MQFNKVNKIHHLAAYEVPRIPDNTIEIEQAKFLAVADKIGTQARFPLLVLRILIHIICSVDTNGQVQISARHLAKKLDAHYDTVTKCLKYLREIEVIEKETRI